MTHFLNYVGATLVGISIAYAVRRVYRKGWGWRR